MPRSGPLLTTVIQRQPYWKYQLLLQKSCNYSKPHISKSFPPSSLLLNNKVDILKHCNNRDGTMTFSFCRRMSNQHPHRKLDHNTNLIFFKSVVSWLNLPIQISSVLLFRLWALSFTCPYRVGHTAIVIWNSQPHKFSGIFGLVF